ncbi:MAG TPA: hypothetical protein VFQ51_13290 [Vicinamibacteria bacterium]|nr:hypothetical protein [Vicinamibacteria bacterium]
MATLEDAAEELVVKLRGLDTEIEESEQKMADLRQQVDTAFHEVDREWTTLSEAAKSFLEKVGEDQEQLDQKTREALQGVADAQEAVTRAGKEAQTEIAEGHAQLDALGQHATSLEPAVDSLATEAGEAPAKSLAERVHELEEELAQVVDQACTFLRDEVVPGVAAMANEVQERCVELHQELAEEATAALQKALEHWESQVDGLEQHVTTQGFQASYQHARDVVEYAVEECETASGQKLDALQQVVGVLLGQLTELASEVEQSTSSLVSQAGQELTQELEHAHTAAAQAVAALDRVKQTLAGYGFVEA